MAFDRARLRLLADRWLPPVSGRRDVAKVGVGAARDLRVHLAELRSVIGAVRPRPAPHYAAWLADHRAEPRQLAAERAVASGPRPPQVDLTIVVVAGRGDEEAALTTLRSLQVQSDRLWSAQVRGGANPDCADERVTVVDGPLPPLLHLFDVGEADGFVVVLEAGDLVEPDFVFQIVSAVWERPMAQLVHWDDDVADDDGTVDHPRMRPSWSPDMLLSANYLGRSVAVRRSRLRRDDAPPDGDAAWWDLVLGLDLQDEEALRLPRVLVHLSRRPDPVAGGAAVVNRHLVRRGIRPEEGRAEDANGAVRMRWSPPEWPSVAVIIPTRHNRPLVEGCLRSVAASDYPRLSVRIVDNGPATDENRAWYAALTAELGLDLVVQWWDEPFNYSRVNNVAAAGTDADLLVFLNDDTVAVDPGWLRELAGWASLRDIGLVGLQLLDADDRIQHGGVVLGMHGFADHLFQGMSPGEDSLIGSTRWYRNVLSVTAACVAVRRSVFEQIGGFDERFVLCGSDVVMGLDTTFLGLRNVCSPFAEVRHLESATRGTNVPDGDFYASYWRYHKWLVGGDRYYSPNLSLWSTRPALRAAHEPPVMATASARVGRPHTVFRQSNDEAEVAWLQSICRADSSTRPKVQELHSAVVGEQAVRSVNWFLPDVDSPFYGGVNTALRIADLLAAEHGVTNQFVLMAEPNAAFFESALAAAFPRLAGSPVSFYDGSVGSMERSAPDADVSIATLWVTAYAVARFTRTRRRFYLIQDFEPMFYPAGSLYALTEETYRLGLYGLCNTHRLRDIYGDRYDGIGQSFMPAVQSDVFHAVGRRPLEHDGPARVFLYARPGHWRNCWELAGPALDLVKERFGQDVHIVTAGSWARPQDLGRGIDHLGLLDYRDTGALYRTCDVGVALTLSEHPSYLPLELMACGVPVVAFDNPAGDWIMESERNSLRTPRTVDGLAEGICRLVESPDLRSAMSAEALRDIAARHSSWADNLAGIYGILSDPERR